jgi:hypothetical protein
MIVYLILNLLILAYTMYTTKMKVKIAWLSYALIILFGVPIVLFMIASIILEGGKK